ncbi:ABC transporter ATP-binding protein [Breznakiellaceae bacterium SP9]
MKISFTDVHFGYGSLTLFNGLSMELGEWNPVVILGPSGCGKTSLLRLIAGIEQPESGSIHLSACDTQGVFSPVSFVFQEDRLLPWFTLLENVSFPAINVLGRKAALERALYYLERTGLYVRAGSYPSELSGGERQRVSLARGFAYPAPILLMDEPFQSLDIPLRYELMDLTLSLLGTEKRLVVEVTHDPREAIYQGQHIIVLGAQGQGIVYNKSGTELSTTQAHELELELLRALGTKG